jgi:hypothetical protein
MREVRSRDSSCEVLPTRNFASVLSHLCSSRLKLPLSDLDHVAHAPSGARMPEDNGCCPYRHALRAVVGFLHHATGRFWAASSWPVSRRRAQKKSGAVGARTAPALPQAQELVRLQTQTPARIPQTVLDRALGVHRRIRSVHWL